MTLIEFIQSTGTQYIFTDYIPNLQTRVVMKCKILGGGNFAAPFGSRVRHGDNGFLIFAKYNGSNSAKYAYGGVVDVTIGSTASDYDSDITIELSSSVVKFGSATLSITGTGLTSSAVNLALFTLKQGNSDYGNDTHINMMLYFCEIYEGDSLIHNYLPVLDDNDVPCLFDDITHTYLYNNGTGVFIPGDPIVPPPPPTGEFPITIQKNNSEPIHLTKDLTDILSTNVWLKEDTSIIDPVFVLETSLSDLIEANYVTVPTFGRSYFITNITSISTDLVELTCHVDVLSSFADEIKANKGIIFRQEHDWNLYLNDGVIQAYQDPIITTQLFPKGFTQQNFVLVAAGSRGIGSIGVGQGGSIDIGVSDGGGAGNTSSKTTAGLITYCKAQIGNPYWFGTFGNIASQALLDYKREQYPTYYPDPGSPDFTTQFGQRVHDCVGLIKGYRWSDTPASVPQYVISEDVDVRGLYTQCNRMRGNVDFSYTSTLHLEGMLVFDAALTHVGVYIGNGKIIEAQGHAYGVVQNNAYDRRAKFTLWGVPDWLQVTTSMS